MSTVYPSGLSIARAKSALESVFDVIAGASVGMTADEVAEKLSITVLTVRPRVSELFKAGRITKTGVKRPNESGLEAHVWVTA
jgi:predicted transcriptional regulator